VAAVRILKKPPTGKRAEPPRRVNYSRRFLKDPRPRWLRDPAPNATEHR